MSHRHIAYTPTRDTTDSLDVTQSITPPYPQEAPMITRLRIRKARGMFPNTWIVFEVGDRTGSTMTRHHTFEDALATAQRRLKEAAE